MKTGGGKNFSCFFNYFPKAKSWKAQSFSLRHRSNAEANMS